MLCLHAIRVRAMVGLVLRLGAILLAVLPVVLSMVVAPGEGLFWLGALVSAGLGVWLGWVRPRGRGWIVMGTGLAILAGLIAIPRPTMGSQEPTALDLRRESIDGELSGPAALTGFFRTEWMLAEYAVPPGALPQQDTAAAAQLVPLVGVPQGPIPLPDVVSIVRVRPGEEEVSGLHTVQGWAGPLDDELLGAFIQASGIDPPPGVRGVLLDTLHRPTHEVPWVRPGLIGLALLGALGCLWVGTRPTPMQRPPAS